MEEDEELSARFRNRVNVSTTGGKSVKRENRGAGLRKKSSKSGGVMAKGMLGDTMIEYSVDPHERDPTTGKCFRPGGPTTQAHQCTYRERNGRLCTRRFMRLEHLRRHEQVHTGQTDFKCVICPRAFNRNDNRQAHYDTHIRKEGKKDGRNPKMSLRELEAMLIEKDPNGCSRLIEKLRLKHGHGYCANRKRKVAL
ncbi:hypothetical protein B0J11DRAFT_524859 [Dendryphion nanum]|uniref:C2H2-type domain-containing protein n=1 Tax=Dendryphion nanum TaxID=256645 RepID=A0A9P9DXV3_9PLEO|nr:hypothetical protein B0J11DRAFT_524859 [Dendryphion nanum]